MHLLSAGVLLSALSGCGGDVPSGDPAMSVEEQAAANSQAELKALLESVASSGEAGSALAGVESSIQSLSLDDSVKQKLLKDYEQLNSATEPEKVKSIAQRMAGQL